MKNDSFTAVLKVMRQLIKSFPEHSYLAERATNFQEKETPTTCREPYATIIHFDLWTENILNHTFEDGTVRNIFVDFQVYGYRSAAADVFFFLWTSVQKQILEKNLNFLLNYYHQSLLNTLKSFNIDTSTFEYKHFEEELRLESDFEFGHALMFNVFINLKDVADALNSIKYDLDQVSPELKEKIYFMVTECSKRVFRFF